MKNFSSPVEILKVFYEVRYEHYQKRKAWLEGKLTAESVKATSQAKYILETVQKKLDIGMSSYFVTKYSTINHDIFFGYVMMFSFCM